MNYRRKVLSGRDLDEMRINLSMQNQKLGPEPHCDFCGDTNPIYCFAANHNSQGDRLDCWRWCSCMDCAALIVEQDFDAIEMKIAKWLSKKLHTPVIVGKAVAHTVLEEFHRHVIID